MRRGRRGGDAGGSDVEISIKFEVTKGTARITPNFDSRIITRDILDKSDVYRNGEKEAVQC